MKTQRHYKALKCLLNHQERKRKGRKKKKKDKTVLWIVVCEMHLLQPTDLNVDSLYLVQ